MNHINKMTGQCRMVKVEIKDGRPAAYWPRLEINDPNVKANSFYIYDGEFYLVTPVGTYMWVSEESLPVADTKPAGVVAIHRYIGENKHREFWKKCRRSRSITQIIKEFVDGL